ncbi:hypothetical protein LY71_104187 [Geodermatophilus tzadiensis]|uniref:Uncharacterized protein n=1 Tax=Geodermatophilus tzadiensis TaxID=1137988 RepID=A0A2T0TWZ7_9ACTN|nr:hypothetical protein [Geodermatophilus tzadiensis]PRY50150.1 hypothetical protein LY71_104187 [Geodermatophilus tzadiensis]
MSTHENGTSPYRRALEAARALGRADGRLAVDVEPDGEPVLGPWCHGLDPEGLAHLVWEADGGPAPAGVVLNAPLWYAQGFREALACARAQQAGRHLTGRRPDRTCRPPAGRPCARLCGVLPAPRRPPDDSR